MKFWKSAITVASLVLSTGAYAALVQRLGGQAVYDTELDITWVANANLARTETFGLPVGSSLGTHPADSLGMDGVITVYGDMNWAGMLHWFDAMNDANYLGFNDWRLPTTLVPDASCSGSDSTGFNCSGSEMGHLYYEEFGALANGNALSGDKVKLAMFTELQTYIGAYMSGTAAVNDAWIRSFNLFAGGQANFLSKELVNLTWAVRSGDVAVVPAPAALWLFSSGLAGLFGLAKRKARA